MPGERAKKTEGSCAAEKAGRDKGQFLKNYGLEIAEVAGNIERKTSRAWLGGSWEKSGGKRKQ